ncbi:hypothetical protein [Fibrella forsythiae]|uniref:DUF3592 domain-containing protein n=1 Tax=Fibrella forsythiae TaxID=2817061 RepID=A0ABS3JPC5_9BACT|nr:hypothetical protein [Fibrella forsythiae]MBO0951059.1 hypothetical protein [Fibrella forsythiae]
MIVPVWLLSVSLGGVGSWLLIQGVRRILKAVGGPVLLKLPLTQPSGQFELPRAGEYAIWQSGRTLQRVPATMPWPAIVAAATGEMVRVHQSFSTVRVNNGWEGRIQLFSFRAKAGQYRLELPPSESTALSASPYFLEIRERKPSYLLVWGILLLIIGAGCVITGLALPAFSIN